MNLRKRIACRLQQLRQDNKISQAALADSCGVDRSFIGRLELGNVNVSVDTLAKLAAGLHTTVADFFNAEIFANADVTGNDAFKSLHQITKELQYHLEELVDSSTSAEMPVNNIILKDGRKGQVTVKLETDEDNFQEPGVSYEISL